jgi:hypothetical protein
LNGEPPDILQAVSSEKALVFVSCGQYTESERKLGKDICQLLRRLRPDVEPYFADNQSTPEGLSDHILKALHRAAGFICVMHARGSIATPDGATVVRASVWVEQEIAMVAFMSHVLGRSIPTLFYRQAGIHLEGIRSVLLMNPRVEFTDEASILDDLGSTLPSIQFAPFNAYEVLPVLSYQRANTGKPDGDRHNYKFTADVKIVGTERVTDFKMLLFFPRAFLDPFNWAAEDKAKSTSSHTCFSATAEQRASKGLYSGDTMEHPLTFLYFVDHGLRDDPEAMHSEIIVELFSGRMTPKRLKFEIGDFQDF